MNLTQSRSVLSNSREEDILLGVRKKLLQHVWWQFIPQKVVAQSQQWENAALGRIIGLQGSFPSISARAEEFSRNHMDNA